MVRKIDTLFDTCQPIDKYAIAARLAHDTDLADAKHKEIAHLKSQIRDANEGDGVREMEKKLLSHEREYNNLAYMHKSWNQKDGPPWVDMVQLLLASPIHTLIVKHAQKKDKSGKAYARDYFAIDWRATWKLHPHIRSTKVKSRWQKAINALTLQNLKRQLREASVIRHGVLDLDMVAAHIAIVLDLLQQNGAPSKLVENVRWYLCDRDKVLEKIQTAYGVSRGEAKTLMGNLALYQRDGWKLKDWAWKSDQTLPNGEAVWHKYTPLPDADQAFVHRLGEYITKMQEARAWIMKQTSFKGLHPDINGKRMLKIAKDNGRTKAKRLKSAFSYLLQSVERVLLHLCVYHLVRTRQLGVLWAPIHDGYNFKPNDDGVGRDTLTAACMESVPSIFPSVKWIVKPFDGWHPRADLPSADAPYDGERASHLAILQRHARPVPGPTEFKVPCTEKYTERHVQKLEFDPKGGAIVVRSPMGTGKTHQNAVMIIEAMKHLLDVRVTLTSSLTTGEKLKEITSNDADALHGKLRIVVVLPRISLGLEYHRRMNEALNKVSSNAEFLFYRDEDGYIRDSDEIRGADRIVIQVDSLCRLQGLKYDYLIVDESEAVVDQLISSKHAFINMAVLLQLIKGTKHVILQDAFADEATRRLLAYAKREDATWIQNNFQPYAEREGKPQMRAYFHWKEGEVMPMIKNYLSEGKGVFVPCTSQTTGKVVYDKALSEWELNPEDVIFIRGDDKLNGVEEKAAKMEALLDINTAAKRVKLFIISPSMTVGNSIDLTGSDAFDVICGYVEPNSIGARDFLQQLARPRELRDNEMHIELHYFGGNPRTDADACLKRAHQPRIYEEDYVEYFENVESLRSAHLQAHGQVALLHGSPCLDLDTTKVRRAESESNNSLFFLEVLRETERKNRLLDMVDDIWAGLLHMGAYCEDWVSAEATDTPQPEGVNDSKTIYQMKKQESMRANLLVTEVDLIGMQGVIDDVCQLEAAENSYDITLTDRQRALRTRFKLQDEYGIDDDQWEAIQESDKQAVEKSKQSSGSLPQSCWASRYGGDAIEQYRMFSKLLPHATDAGQQQMLCDTLAKKEAYEHAETEEERSMQRTRVKSMYRAKTSIDILSLLGFQGGIFDPQQLSAEAMLGSKEKRQRVANAIAKWLSQLEPSANATLQAEDMTRIAAGGEYNKRLADIVKVVNERFLKPSFGVSLKASNKRSRDEKSNPDLRKYKIDIDSKFRIEGISDDGDITKPLVKKTECADPSTSAPDDQDWDDMSIL